jgi:uncharacterized protein (TIGR00251 family)
MATLNVKVVPGAKRDELVGRYGDAIKIRVSAPPENGNANTAVIGVLAGALGVRPGAIRLVRGQTSPRKTFEVDGLDDAALGMKLSTLLDEA